MTDETHEVKIGNRYQSDYGETYTVVKMYNLADDGRWVDLRNDRTNMVNRLWLVGMTELQRQLKAGDMVCIHKAQQ